MLFLTGITGLLSSCEIYHQYFKYLPDIFGYSLFTNLIFLRVYSNKKYCHATIFAVYGLIAMNLISIITIDTKYYNPLYDSYIALITLAVVYYLYFRK